MSEGLKALKDLSNELYYRNDKELTKTHIENRLIIEKELKEGEKNKQAIEIIKSFLKAIGLKFIFWNEEKRAILITDNNEFEYWYYCKTQEEYDLLKEVLL